jgi:two-component system NtrC family sensor kinase
MENGANVLNATSERDLSELNFTLGHYVQSLDDSVPLAGDSSSTSAIRRKSLLETLDGDSVALLNKLRSLKSRAAAEANHVLKISQVLPFFFCAVMLIIIFWITILIAGTITTSLERLQRSTRRIASGNFRLMNPRRRYHDEFSDLALAVNRMLLELRAREAQVLRADKLANIGAFTEGVAGELNTALDSISGMARTFVEGCQSPDECPHYNLIQDIVSETEKGKQTVEELLAFTGDDLFKPEPLDFYELVESAHRLLKNKMTRERVEFKNEVPSDLPSVQGSFNQLKHVLLNLFQNAIQAMPQGGLLEVKASRLEGHKIEVTVTDEGVGIPPEDLDHVFDPLYTTKDGTKGMGLGLSISYAIVRKHGGSIRVVSLVGKGTTIHLTLPLAEAL